MLIISMKSLPKADQHDYAHRLLRECLRAHGIEYSEKTPVILGKLGKPSLAEHPHIHYNLTHADGIAACTSGKSECGIDAERVREYRPNVMKRAFTESEMALVENAQIQAKNLIFFRIWTLKEAYVKALGIGISYPLKNIEFLPDGDDINTNVTGYSFRQYMLRDGEFVVSVCEKDEN